MAAEKESFNYWEELTLEQMTKEQWEMLCDGCGLCCLHKFEDEATDEVFFTDVVCRYLDEETCRCQHYQSQAICT